MSRNPFIMFRQSPAESLGGKENSSDFQNKSDVEDCGCHYPLDELPEENDETARCIYSSIIMGAYSVRLFIDYFESLVDYGRIVPFAESTPLGSSIPSIESYKRELESANTKKSKLNVETKYRDKYKAHYEKYPESNAALYHFLGNGYQKRLDTDADIDTFNPNDHTGFYLYDVAYIRAYYPTVTNLQKINGAILKSIYFALDGTNFKNDKIGQYLTKLWSDRVDQHISKYSGKKGDASLMSYYRMTPVEESILAGKDPLIIDVIPKGTKESNPQGLFEYCEKTTTYISAPDIEDPEVNRIRCKLQRLAQLLKTMHIHDISCESGRSPDQKAKRKNANCYVSFEFDENNPPLAFTTKSYKSDFEDALRLVGVIPQKYPPSTEQSTLELKGYQDSTVTPVTITDPNVVLMPFIDFQHERLHLKRLLCTSVEKLTDQYVDLSYEEDNSIYNTVISLLNEKKSVLVYGSGGMGKSTLSYVVYEHLYKEYKRNASNPAPIIVSPRVFMDEGLTASNILDITVRDCNTELSQNVVCDPHRVVLFIDAIDEYFKPESEGLEKLVLYTRDYTKIVTGRTEVSRSIAYAFKEKPIDLKNAIDETLFEKIYRQYSENRSNYDEIHEFITQLKGLESTPLVAAMIATFLSKNSITYVNGKPVRGALYNDLVSKMVLDKLGTINRACSTEMSQHAAMNILSEYAWTRYRWPIKNYEDRLDLVSHKAHYNKQSCRALLDEFTESDGMEDRLFLHMSIQDYLVAKWVVRQSSAEKIDDEFLNIMFRTDVQRFVGDFMKLSPNLAVQITSFCIRVIRDCDFISDESLKNNYQSKMIYLLARGAFVGNCSNILCKPHIS